MNTKKQKKLLKESIESQVKFARLYSLKEVTVTIPKCDGLTEDGLKGFLADIGYQNIAYIGNTEVLIDGRSYKAITVALII